MTEAFRPGTLVEPVERLSEEKIRQIHKASLQILDDPGILCFSEEAVAVFRDNGCQVEESTREEAWVVRIPENVVEKAVASAPSKVVLGGRTPDKDLVLDSQVPRVYFGTGSETNIYLETTMETFQSTSTDRVMDYPVFHEKRGAIKYLCESAHLCNALPNVDFFIRNVNVQDDCINAENKDVNVFFASLMHMSKHVQAGITDINALDNVLQMAEIVAGSKEALQNRSPVSFIACLVKSPLQMVDDTTAKVIQIAKRKMPLVISSCPQGGSSAPIQEEGMTAMINAEILSGITLTQLVSPGSPVLYGAVPVRARLDTLYDLYGVPDFTHYNMDCVQVARHYKIPCYSTAGVGDAKVPGMQAMVEKLQTYLGVAPAGAQYIHYAFGLLDRTNIFSPLQAVMDDASLKIVRDVIRKPNFNEDDVTSSIKEVRKVMKSQTRLFARHIRKQVGKGVVSEPYSLAGDGAKDEVFTKAYERLEAIRAASGELLSQEKIKAIYDAVPGILAIEKFSI